MLCDAISVVMTISVVLAVNLNLVGLFGHDLVSYHPLVFYYLLIMVSGGSQSVQLRPHAHLPASTCRPPPPALPLQIGMRSLQLGLILFSRERYWRLRTRINFCIKAFVGSFVINALITAGVSRRDYFFSPDWMGGEGGQVTSSAAIYRALLLPTGCLSALFDTIAHQVPLRLVVLLQLINTAAVVGSRCHLLLISCAWLQRLSGGTQRTSQPFASAPGRHAPPLVPQVYASWGPVSLLLHAHQKLTDDAFWMCEMASEAMGAITGFGGPWQPLRRGSCAGSRALTKTGGGRWLMPLQPCLPAQPWLWQLLIALPDRRSLRRGALRIASASTPAPTATTPPPPQCCPSNSSSRCGCPAW